MTARDVAESDDDPIGQLLATARVVAVVGLSPDAAKESHHIARYLQEAGYDIIPVNPKAESILGGKSYPSVDALPERPDIVQVFRSPEHVPAIVEAAIRRRGQGSLDASRDYP